MKRLTPSTLEAFLRDSETAVLMFGATNGEATMAQAEQFAIAWAEHRSEAGFGYVDAFAHAKSARTFSIRVLPTILVLRGGVVLARLEGRCASYRITAAICAAKQRRAAA